MSLVTYKPFVDRMINRYEGGYGWNRKDTGGPTKYGITCYDLAEHRGQRMDSMARWAPIVAAMTLVEAEEIYQKKYANAIRYNDLPAGVDTEMLDYGVNSGISRPIHVVRAILIGSAGSGVMDMTLLNAIRKANPHKLIDDISAERLHFMHAIRGGSAWAEFGGGWGSRVADLKAYSHHLESGSPPPLAPDLTKVTLPKAKHGSPNTVKNVIKTAGGTAAGSGTTAHYSGFSPTYVGIVIGAVVVAGVAYAIYARQRALTLNATVILPPAQPIIVPPAVIPAPIAVPPAVIQSPVTLPPAPPTV